jgi:SAM-dependent methyltransferase
MPTLTSASGNILHGYLSKDDALPSISFDVFRRGDRLQNAVVVSQEGVAWPFHIILPHGETISNGPSITVRIAETDHLVPISPDLKGFVNDVNELGNGHFIDNAMFFSPLERNKSAIHVPQSMIDHVAGGGTQESFRLIGYSVILDMLKFGVLNSPSDKFFELGCGCGRIGGMLGPMLDETQGGSYNGFDIWADGIEWGSANISTLYPHIQFGFLGNHNEYVADVAYPIDLESESKNCFVATSVFTHLRAKAADFYVSEIARILKSGGKGYITFFASKERFREIQPNAAPEEDDYAINYVNVQAEDTFVEESSAVQMFERHGLCVMGIKYGSWRGQQFYRGHAGHQDLFIVKKH